MGFEQLKLENQLCFPVYAASRLIIREYQPYLDKLGITYPQYLVLMVLWENNGLTVNEIAHKLVLNTNTITPLLKRMEQQQIVVRERSHNDERKVIVSLTGNGIEMREKAAEIPLKLIEGISKSQMSFSELNALKVTLQQLINVRRAKEH
jgi:MarR family transcriptional regulator, organic hydroperoxide resistance regulator